jgi:hypothetical protein
VVAIATMLPYRGPGRTNQPTKVCNLPPELADGGFEISSGWTDQLGGGSDSMRQRQYAIVAVRNDSRD